MPNGGIGFDTSGGYKDVENPTFGIDFLGKEWRKRSIPTHSEWLYPLTFDAGKGLKEA